MNYIIKAFKVCLPVAGALVLFNHSSCQPAAARETLQSAPFADKYWKISTITVSPAVDLDLDGKPDTDMRILIEDCDKDNAEMYHSNKKIIEHVGKVRCDEYDEEIVEKGTWKYDAATQKLTMDMKDTGRQVVTVVEAASRRLVLHYPFMAKDGKHLVRAVYSVK